MEVEFSLFIVVLLCRLYVSTLVGTGNNVPMTVCL